MKYKILLGLLLIIVLVGCSQYTQDCSKKNISDYDQNILPSGSFEIKFCNRWKQDIDWCRSDGHLDNIKPEYLEEVILECEEDEKNFIYSCICPSNGFEQVELQPFE